MAKKKPQAISLDSRFKKSIVTVALVLWGILTAFLIYESFFHYVSLTEDTANACFFHEDGTTSMTLLPTTKGRIVKVERAKVKQYINDARDDNRCIRYTYGR